MLVGYAFCGVKTLLLKKHGYIVSRVDHRVQHVTDMLSDAQ